MDDLGKIADRLTQSDLDDVMAKVDADFRASNGDDAPPPSKPKRAPKVASGPSMRAPSWKTTVSEGLTQQMIMLGMVFGTRCAPCGQHIVNSTDKFVAAALNAAEHSPRIRKTLVTMTSGSVYAEFALAGVMLIAPIAMHHNMLPPNHTVMAMAGIGTDPVPNGSSHMHDAGAWPQAPVNESDEVMREAAKASQRAARRSAKPDNGS